MAFGKVLTTIVTEVELTHITAVESIRKATGYALRTLRLNITPIVRTLVVKEECIHGMLLGKSMIIA